METVNHDVLNELRKIRVDINIIKENLIGEFSLDEDDINELENYKKEKENNELISHEELKKELGL